MVVISVYSGETPTGMAAISSVWIASASCEGRDPLLALFLHSHPLWSMNFLSWKSASSLACFGSACKKIRSFLVEGIKEMHAVNYKRPEVMPGLLNVIGRIGK